MDETELRNVSDAEIERRKRVDVICDDFERQWAEGNPPSIEGTLGKLPEEDQRLLFQELLKLEIEIHKRVGKNCDRDDYRKRFPDRIQCIDRLFASSKGQAEPPGRTVELKPNDTAAAHSESVKERANSTKISSSSSETSQEPDPTSIDRFTIHGKLGVGGFGIVYLATDPLAGRDVAIKVPKSLSPSKLEMFLEDARTASQLTHPGIVRIYEVSASPLPYVVQEYLPGGDLGKHVRRRKLSPHAIVELMIPVADAVGFAHQHGYTHLDLKPDNILIREDGQPCVVDFGLAVHESGQWSQAGRLAGTVSYMSPEQAAGEVHRIDGRSDIWSLGVIFYELLVEKLPFNQRPTARQLDEIRFRDPRPIRQHKPDLPRELWRIIQCCLAKSVLERYQSTADLVDDLKQWLLSENQDQALEKSQGEVTSATDHFESIQIIPQGLRSFEAEHARFYLSLLPGPHDRDGLPSRVRFWKKQIESFDPDESFSVGLMYGPSGCGKSSLVKAGLLPHLDRDVTPVYLEATANDTEVRLLKCIRKAVADAPDDADLPSLIAAVRERQSGNKLLIVIDQFEQWLHSHAIERTDQLVRAMRQCDGAGVQCVVLVRDDFWMSATNFMRALDVPLTEGVNSAPVGLFDLDHAWHVLRLLGIAYGKLPSLSEELSDEQSTFVDTVVRDLASNDKVVCVRLAVFAEMMKGRPWNRRELDHVGGADGVGISFLNETFSGPHCPPMYRRHRKAIRAVLEALLPNAGLDIKGQMKSYDELQRACSYIDKTVDFDGVLAILDGDTKLITPTEPDGEATDSESRDRYYQLAHDFLVPSLRDWLTRQKRETWPGTAELRLTERAELWRAKREDRQLPSMWEYGLINLFIQRSRRSPLEQKMMRRADRVRGRQAVVTMVVCLGAIWGLWMYPRAQARITQGYIESVVDSPPQGLSGFIDNLRSYDSYAIPLLKKELEATASDQERLNLACALSELGVKDFEFPMELIGRCDAGHCSNIVRALERGPSSWRDQLVARCAWCDTEIAAVRGEKGNIDRIRYLKTEKVRLAIVGLHLDETEPAIKILASSADPSERTFFIAVMAEWHGDQRQLEAIGDFASAWPFENDFDFLSGVVMSLGDHFAVKKSSSVWIDVLERWFQECKSGGVHNACGWALRKAGVADSDLTQTAKGVIRTASNVERDWDVTSTTDLTLVKVPASPNNNALWMSDREITVALFLQFVEETEGFQWRPQPLLGVGAAVSGIEPVSQSLLPAENVSLLGAAKFCNWLTEREGDLTKCYRFEQNADGMPQAVSIEGATGFRLEVFAIVVF